MIGTNESVSLAELRQLFSGRGQQVFGANIELYILAANGATPAERPIPCVMRRGEMSGMTTYLSPLDAMIHRVGDAQLSQKFDVHPFDNIDPRPYVDHHEGQFNIYLAYGFSARNKQLMAGPDGELCPLTMPVPFRVLPEHRDEFYLNFNDGVTGWLEKILDAARFADFDTVMNDLADSPRFDLARQAETAIGRAGKCVPMDHAGITHCGLYDAVECKWLFVDLAEIDPPSA